MYRISKRTDVAKEMPPDNPSPRTSLCSEKYHASLQLIVLVSEDLGLPHEVPLFALTRKSKLACACSKRRLNLSQHSLLFAVL